MCFDKLVSISDCFNEDAAPVTGLYLDKITGLTTKELDQIAVYPYNNGYDLFVAKREAAWQLMSAQLINRFRPKFKADSITENETVGYLSGSLKSDPLPGYWVGIKFEVSNPNSFMDLFFSNLTLLLPKESDEVEVRVYDLDTNLPLKDTFGNDLFFNLKPNERTFKGIKVENPRGVKRIAILYESKVSAERTILSSACGTCGGGFRMINFDPFVKAVGIKVAIDEGGEIVSKSMVGYTYGLIADYSLSCSRSAFLCSIGNDVALPFTYLIAAELIKYALDNSALSRVNNTVDSVDVLNSRYQTYMIAYSEQLEGVIQSIRIPNDEDCFFCNKNNRFIHFSV